MRLIPNKPVINIVKANVANIFLRTTIKDKSIVPTYLKKDQKTEELIPDLEFLFDLANDEFNLGDALGIVSAVVYFSNTMEEIISVLKSDSHKLVNVALEVVNEFGISINQKEYAFYCLENPTDSIPCFGVHFFKTMFVENEHGQDGLSDIGYILDNLKNFSEQIFINTLELDSHGIVQMGRL